MAKTSGLAIASFILSLLFLVPFCGIVGAILGIVALSKINKNPELKGKGLAIFGIAFGFGGYFLIFMLMGVTLFIVDILSPPHQPPIESGFDERDFQEMPIPIRQMTYTIQTPKFRLSKEYIWGVAYYHKGVPTQNARIGFQRCMAKQIPSEEMNKPGGYMDHIMINSPAKAIDEEDYEIFTLFLRIVPIIEDNGEERDFLPGDYICSICVYEDANNNTRLDRETDMATGKIAATEKLYYCEQKNIEILSAS